jgi:predicted amino acid dehydrogenase
MLDPLLAAAGLGVTLAAAVVALIGAAGTVALALLVTPRA